MTDLSLFDAAEGSRRRDEAILRVDANAPSSWKRAALQAVRMICEKRDEFTTDEVWFILEVNGVDGPHEPRAMGPIMMQAERRRWCAKTDDWRNSVRADCHARPLKVWRSLL